MSYDRSYVCRSLDQSTWLEKRQMESDGRSEEFGGEFNRLYDKGDFVVLVAGANLLFDELYLFEQSADAEQFYRTDFTGRESFVDDRPCGFEEVSLFRGGELVATKAQPTAEERSVPVAVEQSKKELTRATAVSESNDDELLEFD